MDPRSANAGRPRQLPPLPPSGINPSDAGTVQEFGCYLKQLIEVRGMSANQLATASELSSSTVSDLINGRRLGRPDTIHRVLASCRLPSNELDAWLTKRIELLGLVSDTGRQKLSDRIQELKDELIAAHGRIAGLQAREAELQAALDAEQLHASQLAKLQQETIRRAKTLKDELSFVQEELRRTGAEYLSLIQEIEMLKTVNEALLANADLVLHERELRIRTEGVIAALREEISNLGKVSEDSPYPRAHLLIDEFAPKDPSIEKNLSLQDADFGMEHDLAIPFKWFCTNCNKGGRTDTALCPHCDSRVTKEYVRKILIELPITPRYNTTLILAGQGNHDDPLHLAGDIRLRLKRSGTTWSQRG